MSTYFQDSFTDGPQGSCQSLKVDKKNIALGKIMIYIVLHSKVSVPDMNSNPRASLIIQTIKAQHNSQHILFCVFYSVLQTLPKGVGVSSSVLMLSLIFEEFRSKTSSPCTELYWSKEACC